jgi:hypothetical protein
MIMYLVTMDRAGWAVRGGRPRRRKRLRRIQERRMKAKATWW